VTSALTTLAQLSEYSRPGFWYGLLALLGFWVAAIFIASMVERRLTRPYARATAVRPGTLLHPYHATVNERAAQLGFIYGGTFQHPKFAVQMSVWISPDHLMLIETGAGTILRRTVRQTEVFTRTSDGLVLVSADYYGDGDSSGLLQPRQHFNGSLDDVLALHRRRIDQSPAKPRPFAERSPLDALHAIYAERADRLVRSGRARWLAPDRDEWRYTFSGAVAVLGFFFVQLGRALTRPWRRYRPRPGMFTLPQPLDPQRYRHAPTRQ
jgi:hypothetical protein